MPANAGYVLGAGWSPSLRVKSIGSGSFTNADGWVDFATVAGKTDSMMCGLQLTFDSASGANLAIAYADVAPATGVYTDSVQLDLGGSIYLHNVDPAKVFLARTASGTTTVKYVVYF